MKMNFFHALRFNKRLPAADVAACYCAGLALLLATALTSAANDNRENGIAISNPLPQTVNGSNVNATDESWEQQYLDDSGSTVWWNWQAPADGLVSVDTFGSDFDTVLHVFYENGPFIFPFTDNDDAGNGLQSRAVFNAVQGQTYHIRVAGYEGDQGAITLNLAAVMTNDGSDNWADATVINNPLPFLTTGSNENATVEVGEPDLEDVDPDVEALDRTIWWRWQAPANGILTVDTGGSDFDTVLHVYSSGADFNALGLVADNDPWADSSSPVPFAVAQVVQGQTYDIRVSAYDGDGGNLILNLDFAPPVTNDDWDDAILIPGSVYQARATNVDAGVETGEPDTTFDSATVWWRWQAPSDGTLKVQANVAIGLPILKIYKSAATLGGLTLIEGTSEIPSEESVPVEAGMTYDIRVSKHLAGYPEIFDLHLKHRGGSLSLSLPTGGVREDSWFTPSGRVTRLDSNTDAPLVVTLTSSNTGQVTVPATVTIPAGEESETFVITAVDDSVEDSNQTVTITAEAGDLQATNLDVVAIDDDLAPVITTITSTADGGAGSLRQAILDANASAGNDLILLAPGTYPLTVQGREEDSGATGDLDIASLITGGTLTIRGQGTKPSDTIIDGNEVDRIFHVLPFADLTVENVRIEGGRSFRDHNMTLDPDGAGVRNEGTLQIERSVLRNNTAFLKTFQSEEAANGGAIASYGPLAIRQSAVFDNASGYESLGWFHYKGVGGIYARDGILLIENSTIAKNSGKGVSSYTPSDILRHVTITENGAGMSAYMLHLENSIIAGNEDFDLGATNLTEAGNNLTTGDPGLAPFGNYGGLTPGLPPLREGPAIDAAVVTVDTPVVDQRGLSREVDGNHPVDGSALPDIGAIETDMRPATPEISTVTTFQDGGPGSLRDLVKRLVFGDHEIRMPGGTYELTNQGPGENNGNTGDLDLSNPFGSIILIGDGATAADTVIEGGANTEAGMSFFSDLDRVLEVLPGAEVRLENLTVTGGRARDGVEGTSSGESGKHGENGGGILNAGILSLHQAIVTGNRAGTAGVFFEGYVDYGGLGGSGGGIFNTEGSTLTVVNSIISNNEAGTGYWSEDTKGGDGGGISADANSSIVITDTTFSGNQAGHGGFDTSAGGGSGGAIASASDDCVIARCTFFDNAAGSGAEGPDEPYFTATGNPGGDGGGIFNTGALEVINSTFNANRAGDGDEGDINYEGYLNGDGGHGGAIANQGVVTLIHNTIAGNRAGVGATGGGLPDDGDPGIAGGIYQPDDAAFAIHLENTIIAENTDGAGNEDNLLNEGAGIITEGGMNFLTGNPLLSPLGDHGGITWTMDLLPGSPVLEAALTTGNSPDHDQRGLGRIYGDAPDIGAVEAQAAIYPVVVSTPVIIDSSTAGGRFRVTVTDDSDGTISRRGIVYGLSTDPTVENDTAVEDPSAGPGTFDIVLSDLDAGEIFTIRGWAENEAGISYSAESVSLSTVLLAPNLLTPTDLGPNGFTLHWNPVDGAAGYQIDIATADDFSTFVPGYKALDVGDQVTHPVSGLEYGIPYYVRLRAYRGSSFSADSAPTISIEPQLTGLSPTGSEFVALSGGIFRNFDVVPRGRSRFESSMAIDHLRSEGTFSSTLNSSRRYSGAWTWERTAPDGGRLILSYEEEGSAVREEYALHFLSHHRIQGNFQRFDNGNLSETANFEHLIEGRPTAISHALPGAVQVGEPLYVTVAGSGIALGASVVDVRGLPSGMRYDAASNSISGQARKSGSYELRIRVRNADGSQEWVTQPLEVAALPESAVGTFVAAIERDDNHNDGLGGMLKARVSASGHYSGYVKLGTRRHSFRGLVNVDQDDNQIRMAVSVPRRGQTPIHVECSIEDDQFIVGTIADADGSTPLSGWRQTWHSRRNPVAEELQGNYNALTMLDPEQDLVGDPAVPQGNGFATLRVRSSGNLRWAGKLADGTPLTFSGALGPNAEYFLWRTLYRNQGSLLGDGIIETDANGPLLDNSIWTWLKHPDLRRAARKYPAGFGSAEDPVRLLIAGDLYSVPGRDELQPGFAPGPDNALLTFAEGGLGQSSIDPGIRFELLQSGRGLVPTRGSVENPGRSQVLVSRRTGLIRGSFNLIERDSTTGRLLRRPARFFGIYLPNREQGAGFFLLNQLPDANAAPPTSLRTSPILSGQMGLAPAEP